MGEFDVIINEQLSEIVNLDALAKDEKIIALSTKYSKTKKVLEQQLRKIEKESRLNEAKSLIKEREIPNSDFLKDEPIPAVSLSIGKHNEIFYFGKKLYSKNTKQYSNAILTSDKRLLVDKSYKFKGVHLGVNEIEPVLGDNTSDLVISNVITNESIQHYLGADLKIDSINLFNKIKEQFNEYFDFNNPKTYILSTTYVLLSYVYPLFPVIPYLELNAEKGSGKTKLLELFCNMGFNGDLTTNHTEATFFRSIDGKKGLMGIDEYEPISNKTTDSTERAIERSLNAGYKRGAKIPRNEKSGESYILRYYDVYCPKIIAGISGILLPSLKSRCISPIILRTNNSQGKKYPKYDEPIWQKIRDNCVIWALDNWKAIEKMYYSLDVKFNNRDGEKWKPLLSICKLISEDYYNQLNSYAEEIVEQASLSDQESDNNISQLIETLLKILDKKESGKLSPKAISDSLPVYINKDGNKKPIIGAVGVGKLLTKLGFKKQRDRNAGMLYDVEKVHVDDLKTRLLGEDKNQSVKDDDVKKVEGEDKNQSVKDVKDVYVPTEQKQEKNSPQEPIFDELYIKDVCKNPSHLTQHTQHTQHTHPSPIVNEPVVESKISDIVKAFVVSGGLFGKYEEEIIEFVNLNYPQASRTDVLSVLSKMRTDGSLNYTPKGGGNYREVGL